MLDTRPVTSAYSDSALLNWLLLAPGKLAAVKILVLPVAIGSPAGNAEGDAGESERSLIDLLVEIDLVPVAAEAELVGALHPGHRIAEVLYRSIAALRSGRGGQCR